MFGRLDLVQCSVCLEGSCACEPAEPGIIVARRGKNSSGSGMRRERLRRLSEPQNPRCPLSKQHYILNPTLQRLPCSTEKFAQTLVRSFTMVASQILVAVFVAAASATSLVGREDVSFASLLKRQEPGTPAYNCHDNWCVVILAGRNISNITVSGSAITLSRTTNPCDNPAFVADYNNCLKCSGPDNYNIWRYYGGTLSTAGAGCGFDTEPLSGKQEDVPEAGSTGAAFSAAPTQTSAAVQSSTVLSGTPSTVSSAASLASSTAAPISSQAAATTQAVTSEAPVSSVATLSAPLTTVNIPAVSSAAIHPTLIANATLSSSVPGVPLPSANASASSTTVSTNSASSPMSSNVLYSLLLQRWQPMLLLVVVLLTLLVLSVRFSLVRCSACNSTFDFDFDRMLIENVWPTADYYCYRIPHFDEARV
ncbi:uncharacterized protein EKO05_0008455 [Ascochyta rabiei]|uniref:uncharacterized protein n=1 Tax=Didymella rabiei TaxID=5454 RepID=UPI0022020022|nr:uncharacterized protein EKO05_0008455 [Ascochyta rabiei]UPX18143.1 hypothetical protein EKO05_0008455 [Ascochyta rabiei]